MRRRQSDPFADLPILAELRQQLADDMRAAPPPRPPAPGWGRRLLGLAPVLVAVAGTAVVVVAAILLVKSGGHQPVAPANHRVPPTPMQPAARYVHGAQQAVIARDRACAEPVNRGRTFIHGAPPAALLSELGVLRRPAPAADASNRTLMRNGFDVGGGVYIDAIRRARTAYGKAFYIIPEARSVPFGPIPARCYAEFRRALAQAVAAAPAGLKREALSLQAQQLRFERIQTEHRAGLCFAVVSYGYHGHGPGGVDEGCAQTGAAVPFPPDGGNGEGDRAGGTIVSGIAADGIATITYRYAAGGGHPARTITSHVINNVYVLKIPPDTPHQADPTQIIVRGADGRVILPPAAR